MNCRLTPRVVIAALALLAASCSGERPVLLTEAGPVTTAAATTSSAVEQTTPTEVALAESDCVTASGSSWQLTIEPTPSPPVACLLVANHQRVEFVNNTTDAVSFDLAGLSVAIDPSSTFVTEPAGTFLQPGLTDLNATPHPISGLWLIDPGQRALLGQPIGLGLGIWQLGQARERSRSEATVASPQTPQNWCARSHSTICTARRRSSLSADSTD